jgi:hypothetical protein
MLATEGVFVYALRADTGAVLWCNDTLNAAGLTLSDYRHIEAEAKFQAQRGGVTPGCPLGDGVLMVPNGYAPHGARLPAGHLLAAFGAEGRHGCRRPPSACQARLAGTARHPGFRAH